MARRRTRTRIVALILGILVLVFRCRRPIDEDLDLQAHVFEDGHDGCDERKRWEINNEVALDANGSRDHLCKKKAAAALHLPREEVVLDIYFLRRGRHVRWSRQIISIVEVAKYLGFYFGGRGGGYLGT